MGTLKGAFINFGAGLLGALPNIVVFQFNPDRVTRTPKMVQPPPRDDGSGTHNANLTPGQPSETYSFTLRLDASDQLASSNPIAAASGILPTLSALELLMVPKDSLSINLFSLSGGDQPFQAPPAKLPTVLFFWGPFRIFPVNVTSLSITETEYDPLLNPIRAEVTVSLTVLTPSQIDPNATIAVGAYKYSQGVKEVMAALNLANAAQLGVSASFSLSI
jgi:Contractile injection system tube protein